MSGWRRSAAPPASLSGGRMPGRRLANMPCRCRGADEQQVAASCGDLQRPLRLGPDRSHPQIRTSCRVPRSGVPAAVVQVLAQPGGDRQQAGGGEALRRGRRATRDKHGRIRSGPPLKIRDRAVFCSIRFDAARMPMAMARIETALLGRSAGARLTVMLWPEIPKLLLSRGAAHRSRDSLH